MRIFKNRLINKINHLPATMVDALTGKAFEEVLNNPAMEQPLLMI